jgi:hypothetical protein
MCNKLENNLKGNDRNLVEVLCQLLPGGTEKNYEKPYTVKLVSRLSFESSTSRIQICIVTATLNLLDASL